MFPEQTPLPGGENIQDGIGSYMLGFIGTLLGAVIGVVPWFLASTFAHFFIGWLDFPVGVASCWGHRKCQGARRTSYAMSAIAGCSILTLVVEGTELPTFGRPRAFRVEDIAGMQLSANGRKLFGRDGRILARFEDNQENSALLLQYLRKKEIGLMA